MRFSQKIFDGFFLFFLCCMQKAIIYTMYLPLLAEHLNNRSQTLLQVEVHISWVIAPHISVCSLHAAQAHQQDFSLLSFVSLPPLSLNFGIICKECIPTYAAPTPVYISYSIINSVHYSDEVWICSKSNNIC